ncbi:MAG: diguanylate cyclase domain-containing protein [Actinomycetota bacterium]
MEAISHRVIGRMGGLLFLAAGLVSIVQSALPTVARFNAGVHAGLGMAAVTMAILCWFLPWQRWPRSRTLWLGPIGLILLGATAGFGGFNDFSYGCYFLVVFVWIGVTQPRHTSLWFLPLAGAIYLIPIWYRQREAYALTSVFEVLAMCALVGESLGWVSQHLRRAEALETRRLWDMQGLLKAGDRLARQTEAGEAAAVASDLATQLLRAAAAVVLLPDDGDTLVVGGSARWPGVEVGTQVSRADASTAFAAMRATEPIVFPETGLPSALATRARDGCTLVLVPLRGVGTVQGVLVVDIAREDATLDRFDEDMAMSFGTQAGLMLERLHSVEALMSDALVDELTGLGNRRSANLALSRLQPGDVVVMLDLDRFKELNDTQGHAAGDDVLRAFSENLHAVLREGDAAIRYGGDEFLVLLRGAGARAEDIVERIRARWLEGAQPVGFSAGLSLFQSGQNPVETVARADAALYLDKRSARGPAVSGSIS